MQFKESIRIAVNTVEVDHKPRSATARLLQQRVQCLKIVTIAGHYLNLRNSLNFLSVYGA